MNYWLFKSEPSAWSWEDQVKEGKKGAEWDGVRHHQAGKNMKAMKDMKNVMKKSKKSKSSSSSSSSSESDSKKKRGGRRRKPRRAT